MARAAGEQTRKRILDASEALILGNGYTATSIDEIIGKVGITKGTFFYHFPSKAALARSLIDRYAQGDLELMRANLERAEKLSRDPLQQLLIFVGLYVEMAEALNEPHPGCLFASYIQESDHLEAATIDIVAATVLEWRRVLAAKLSEAVAAHPPRAEVDLDSLADMLTVVFEGAFIVSRIVKDPRTFAQQLAHYRTYLELLFGA